MILVAGIGNVLLGDDGFGVAVVQRLRAQPLEGARAFDFGIRGLDLAYALLDPWDAAILVDATPRGRPPGTLYVIEPNEVEPAGALSMHGADPVAVLRSARAMGSTVKTLRVVGCEPLTVPADDEELSMALSAPVAAAVQPALELIASLVKELADA